MVKESVGCRMAFVSSVEDQGTLLATAWLQRRLDLLDTIPKQLPVDTVPQQPSLN